MEEFRLKTLKVCQLQPRVLWFKDSHLDLLPGMPLYKGAHKYSSFLRLPGCTPFWPLWGRCYGRWNWLIPSFTPPHHRFLTVVASEPFACLLMSQGREMWLSATDICFPRKGSMTLSNRDMSPSLKTLLPTINVFLCLPPSELRVSPCQRRPECFELGAPQQFK